MKKKYQIFVSSTYEDLKEERDLVIKAILEMGHIPVGMEMFSAGDEQQWKLIQTQIDDCDYYILILAFRYGSLDGNVGYTEKEYDYALSKKLPTLGFVIEENVAWSAKKIDKESLKVEKLALFKEKVQGRIVSYWKDKNDLYGKVSIALMKQFNTNPREGWVKSTEQIGPEVLKEISRLSNENAQLRAEVKLCEEQKSNEQKSEFEKLIITLKHNKRKISFYYEDSVDWEDKTDFSLLEIFNLLAPELVIENTTKYCSRYMGLMLKPSKKRVIRDEWAVGSNVVKRVLADLNVLEILHPSAKKHSVKDENQYWALTDIGKKLFKEVRRDILEKNLVIKENIDGSIDNNEESNK